MAIAKKVKKYQTGGNIGGSSASKGPKQTAAQDSATNKKMNSAVKSSIGDDFKKAGIIPISDTAGMRKAGIDINKRYKAGGKVVKKVVSKKK